MSTQQPPHAPHLDVETLADHQEGLLAAEQAAAVAAHLDDCVHCRATSDALDGVQVLLREHGAEGPLAAPDDVVRRLDDALAAAGPPVASASATIIPLTASATRGRSPWRSRALQAAAIFVLVAAVGGIGYGGIKALRGGQGSTDTAASGSAKAHTEKRLAPGTYRFTDSGRDYTEVSLRAAVPELLAGSLPQVASKSAAGAGSPRATAPTAAPDFSASASADPKRLLNGQALAACVANLVGGPVTPLAVDLGKFEGKPATIIVLPAPGEPSFVNVYAVAPGCPTGTFLAWAHVVLP